MPIDSTQLIGIVAFAMAAVACFRAGRGGPPLWRRLAVVQAACGIDIVIGLRYHLHDLVDAVLQARGEYASRMPLQIGLIAVTLAVIGAGLVANLVVWKRLGPLLAGALAGTLLTIALFLVESISLHGIDGLMYAMVGPIKAIGWMWIGTCIVTTAFAIQAERSQAASA